MEAYEDDPGNEVVSSRPPAWHQHEHQREHQREHHERLEQAEARFRSSADRMRAAGAADAARRAEQFAEWAHLERHEPRAARLLHGALRKSYAVGTPGALVDEVLECGLDLLHADRGNVQLADVSTDPGFAPHREIAVASGFRAVQSTPLTARDGRLVGMLSTHYPRPVALPDRELRIIGHFGALIGERLRTLLEMEGR